VQFYSGGVAKQKYLIQRVQQLHPAILYQWKTSNLLSLRRNIIAQASKTYGAQKPNLTISSLEQTPE